MARILVVEDEVAIADTLLFALTSEGHTARRVALAGQALQLLQAGDFDLVVLDVGLPDLSGFEACKQLRRFSSVPVMFLTARGEEIDRVVGLEIGADDYVVKPFSPREVVARVQAVLRRSAVKTPQEEILRWQGLEVNSGAMTVTVTQASGNVLCVDTTPTEFTLLVTLMRAPVRALSRPFLLEECMPDSDALERVIDTHVYNLRKKLEAAGMAGVLLNVRGVGYRFRQP